jgi:hypothetical protein
MRKNRIGTHLIGAGTALLFAALMVPAGAADLDAGKPHPCHEPWAAAGNHGGKVDRHHVGRQAKKYCSPQQDASVPRDMKEAANLPQDGNKSIQDR